VAKLKYVVIVNLGLRLKMKFKIITLLIILSMLNCGHKEDEIGFILSLLLLPFSVYGAMCEKK